MREQKRHRVSQRESTAGQIPGVHIIDEKGKPLRVCRDSSCINARDGSVTFILNKALINAEVSERKQFQYKGNELQCNTPRLLRNSDYGWIRTPQLDVHSDLGEVLTTLYQIVREDDKTLVIYDQNQQNKQLFLSTETENQYSVICGEDTRCHATKRLTERSDQSDELQIANKYIQEHVDSSYSDQKVINPFKKYVTQSTTKLQDKPECCQAMLLYKFQSMFTVYLHLPPNKTNFTTFSNDKTRSKSPVIPVSTQV